MPSMKSRMAAFLNRVNYAEKAFLNREDSRQLDNCFEMYDGEFVVVALMRRAEKNPALMTALRAEFSQVSPSEWSWQRTADKHRRIPDHKLPEAAAQAQIEAEWHNVNVFMPQLIARNEEGAQQFEVVRREGSAEVKETLWGPSLRAVCNMVRSWDARTVMGAPFLSLLAEIHIRTPDGEIYAL